MKKWYHEEYEFQVEVTGFYGASTRSGIAEMGKKWGTSTLAPTVVPPMHLGKGFAPKSRWPCFPLWRRLEVVEI